MRRALLFTLTVSALSASTAYAHHSFAMFEMSKVVTLTGTIKEVQWTNPHIWIQVLVPTAEGGGATEEWSVEGGPPTQLTKNGLTSTTLHEGEKVVIKAHPLKNGKKGGSLMGISSPDGEPIYVEPFQ